MNVKELKARARELGIKGFSGLKKAELADAIATREEELKELAVQELKDADRKARNKAKARRRLLRVQGFQAGPGGRVHPKRRVLNT